MNKKSCPRVCTGMPKATYAKPPSARQTGLVARKRATRAEQRAVRLCVIQGRYVHVSCVNGPQSHWAEEGKIPQAQPVCCIGQKLCQIIGFYPVVFVYDNHSHLVTVFQGA